MTNKYRLLSIAACAVGTLLITGTLVAAPPGAWNQKTFNVQDKVGIGTDKPRNRLDIDFGTTGSIVAGTPLGNGPGLTFFGANGHRRDITGWNGGLYFNASTNSGPAPAESQLDLLDNGYVGIGTGGAVPNILTVRQGATTSPIADEWTIYSSRQYKQDIRSLTAAEYRNALDQLLATDVVRFRYKSEAANAKEKIGIIAEDAPGQLVPEGNPNSVSLNQYIALLHAALKAQNEQIQQQQQSITELEARITRLETQKAP
jgi:hypothetical protein